MAIQPEGLVCAQCQVEVEFGDPAFGSSVTSNAFSGPRLQIAEAAAEMQTGVVDDVRLSTLAEFEILSSRAVGGNTATIPATSTPRRSIANREASPASRKSGPSEPPGSITSLPADTPLYRFDAAHPPVGGRTQAAIEQQRARYAPASVALPLSSLNRSAKQAGDTSAAGSSAAGVSAAGVSALRQDNDVPTIPDRTAARGASPTSGKSPEHPSLPPPGERVPPSPSSEFAIRRVPRSFLLPRSTNRWPGRLCLLSGALFITGQCWLLWSFLRGEAPGVAGGILASAWAFAMALYVIARYCDEDAEQS
ncbi:MAG: hypothetical protein ACK56J_05875 [Planctomycetota bacterium]